MKVISILLLLTLPFAGRVYAAKRIRTPPPRAA